MNVSHGTSVKLNKLKRIPLLELLEKIKANRHLKEQTLALRALQTDEDRRKFKVANLPYFNPGIFTDDIRSDANLVRTKHFVIDCDHLDAEQHAKLQEALKADTYVHFAFRSPSGDGLKVVYELDKEITDRTVFNNAYRAFIDGFSKEYEVTPDAKTADPSRACFLAYDPDIIIHEDHSFVSLEACLEHWEEIRGKTESPVAAQSLPTINSAVSAEIDDSSGVKDAVNHIIKMNSQEANIYDSYSSWQHIGLCLASLGEAGRKHFIRLTVSNPNYTDTEADADAEFSKLLKYYDAGHPNPAATDTLIRIAKKHGFKVSTEAGNDSPVYDKSDMDFASIFINHHRDDIRALHNFYATDRLNTFSKWLTYDGKRWAPDNKGNIFGLVRETVKKLLIEASHCSDRKLATKIEDCVAVLKNMPKQKSMLYQAATDPRITVESWEMDSDIYLFNCLNVTISLSDGNVTVRKHDRIDNISKIALVQYDPDAQCPQWDAFINQACMGNTELIAFVKRSVGLSLTGDVSEQCLLFVFGPGGNGKSVFFKVLMTIFNDYAQKAPSAMLAQQRYTPVPNDVARLQGTRFVVASELDESMVFDEAKVKDLTGGDAIVARFFRQEFFEFEPRFKLWLYGNHKPVIRGTDVGIWRRIYLIPFIATIEEKILFGKLVATLLKEASGILNWALAGYMDYVQNGLSVPTTVFQATTSYKNEQDVISRFLTEKCITNAISTCTVKDLYGSYSKWCQENGEQLLSQRKFNNKLREMKFVTKAGTNNKTEWTGIGIVNNEVIVPVFEVELS